MSKKLIAFAGALLMLVATSAASAEDGEAGWAKNPYFKSADGKFDLAIKNRVQVRYTFEDPDGGDDKGSFRIRRARLTLQGKAFGDVKYKIQAEWGGGSTSLQDAYFQYSANKMAQFRVGQSRAFFARQDLTSSGKQQFVDRSITSGRFSHGRDIGLGLIGVNKNKTFEYNLGYFNGNGRNKSRDDNDNKLVVGRVVFTPFGEYKLEESALDYPSSGKLAVGASFLTNTEGNDDDVDRLGFEFAYKIHGFSTTAEYFQEELDPASGGATIDTDGFYVQAGYLFPNKKHEIAGRYAVVSPDLGSVDADEIETGIAFSHYLSKHNYKVQADWRQIEDELSDTEDTEIRVQLQLSF
ncbi:MAG: porin [Acidobacteriota bacterium]